MFVCLKSAPHISVCTENKEEMHRSGLRFWHLLKTKLASKAQLLNKEFLKKLLIRGFFLKKRYYI